MGGVGAAWREARLILITADDECGRRQTLKVHVKKGKPLRAFGCEVTTSAARRGQHESGGDAGIAEILALNPGARQQTGGMATQRMTGHRDPGMNQTPGDAWCQALDPSQLVEDSFHLRAPLALEIGRAMRIRLQSAHARACMGRLAFFPPASAGRDGWFRGPHASHLKMRVLQV